MLTDERRNELRAMVAGYIGFTPDPLCLTSEALADVDRIIDAGYEKYDNPPPLPPKPE